MEHEGHYWVNKSPLLVPIQKHNNPVHNTPSYLSKIHFNIIPKLRHGFPTDLFPYDLPIKILYVFHLSPSVLHTLSILPYLIPSF
jgi:hypothetical protein